MKCTLSLLLIRVSMTEWTSITVTTPPPPPSPPPPWLGVVLAPPPTPCPPPLPSEMHLDFRHEKWPVDASKAWSERQRAHAEVAATFVSTQSHTVERTALQAACAALAAVTSALLSQAQSCFARSLSVPLPTSASGCAPRPSRAPGQPRGSGPVRHRSHTSRLPRASCCASAPAISLAPRHHLPTRALRLPRSSA